MLTKYGTEATLRPLEYIGSVEYPDGLYDGHDLQSVGMLTIYSVGRTPREALEAFCKARMGAKPENVSPLEGGDPSFSWGFRFSVNGDGCKAAGMLVPGGAILTWWK